MRKWLVILFLLGALALPFSTLAQEPLKLTTLQVQLFPEYDQPSMLVIYEFKLPDAIKLPVNISIGIPKDAKLFAVASQTTDGKLINTDYIGPTVDTDRQVVTIQIQSQVMFHLEYYQPLSKSGEQRDFTYIWAGDYPVDDLGITVRVPVDTNNIITNPILKSNQNSGSLDFLSKDLGPWKAGQQFTLHLIYTKSSDNLSVSQQAVQPSQPLSSTTQGRLILANYLPYVFGVLGFALVVGGVVFFWQSNRNGKSSGRRRSHSRGANGQDSPVYCSQCGSRARSGDRFCRVCGTKLRHETPK